MKRYIECTFFFNNNNDDDDDDNRDVAAEDVDVL